MIDAKTIEEETLADLLGKLRELKKAQNQPGYRHPRGKTSEAMKRGMEIAEALIRREMAAWRASCKLCGGSGLAVGGERDCDACGGFGLARRGHPIATPKATP